MKELTADDVSPMAVRSAQLWLMGYAHEVSKTPELYDNWGDVYEYDEWNHSDGWDLNLYHCANVVRVLAHAVEDGYTDGSTFVCVAEMRLPKMERCEHCETPTPDGTAYYLDGLGTQDRLCEECYTKELLSRGSRMVDTYADLVSQILGGK